MDESFTLNLLNKIIPLLPVIYICYEYSNIIYIWEKIDNYIYNFKRKKKEKGKGKL